MRFEVSLSAAGRWVIGCPAGSVYTCEVDSRNEVAAIAAARKRVQRERRQARDPQVPKQSSPGIDRDWQYCIPASYVPMGRVAAAFLGCTFYVGQACSHHPLNHIRYTSNRQCPICLLERNYRSLP